MNYLLVAMTKNSSQVNTSINININRLVNLCVDDDMIQLYFWTLLLVECSTKTILRIVDLYSLLWFQRQWMDTNSAMILRHILCRCIIITSCTSILLTSSSRSLNFSFHLNDFFLLFKISWNLNNLSICLIVSLSLLIYVASRG